MCGHVDETTVVSWALAVKLDLLPPPLNA